MSINNIFNRTLVLALVVSPWLASCGSPQPKEEAAADAVMETEVAPAHNQLTAAEEEAGWQLLFDGTSTSQWRGYGQESFPEQGWTVQSGELVVLKTPQGGSGGGDIITREQYSNFELSLEFMLTDSANSGILYLAIEQEGKPIWYSAPEYQILDNATWAAMGDLPMETHRTGDNYDVHAAPDDYSKPVGEWNSARIVVNQGHVEHWLNGKKTVEYQLKSPEWNELVAASKFSEYPEYGQASSGYIGLQDHGHEVRFRNIKIRKL